MVLIASLLLLPAGIARATGGFGNFGNFGNGGGNGGNGSGLPVNGNVTVDHTGTVQVQPGDMNHNIHADDQLLGQMDQMQQNWGDTNQQLGVMNQNWSGTNESINGVSHEWGRTNNTLETVTNPYSLGMLAVAGGAGLAIGSAIANGVIYLVKTLVKSLYNFIHEKITHEKENEQLIQDFNKASKEYGSILKAARHLELVLKKLLEIQKALNKAGVSYQKDQAMQTLNLLDARYRTAVKKFEKYSDKALESDEFKDVEKNEFRKIEASSRLEQITKTKEMIEADRSTSLCGSLRKYYHDLILIEDQLESFRSDLLAAKKEWFRRFRKHQKQQFKKIDKVVDDARDIYLEGKKGAKKFRKREIKHIENDRSVFHEACVKWHEKKNYSKVQLKSRFDDLYRKLHDEVRGVRDLDEPDKDLVPVLDSFWGRTLGWKYFYKHGVCRLEYRLEVRQYIPESYQDESYRDYLKVVHKESEQRVVKSHFESYHNTLKHIHLLRKNPEQYAAIIAANLFKNFNEIEADQQEFNGLCSKDGICRVTRAREYLPDIEKFCAVESEQTFWPESTIFAN